MDGIFTDMRRLYERGRTARGLVVDAEGVVLGPDFVLVRRTSCGYRPCDATHLDLVRKVVFNDDDRLQRLPGILTAIAQALDARDMVRAQLLALEIPVGELNDTRLARLSRVSSALRKEYDPNQPRNDRGQWTGSGGAPNAGIAVAGTSAVAVATGSQSILETIGALSLRGLAAGATLVASVAGFVSIPLNRSNVSEGTLPKMPNVSYRYDEGFLRLTLTDDDGKKTIIYEGLPGGGGAYRDQNGDIIGATLPDAKGFVADATSILALAAAAQAKKKKLQMPAEMIAAGLRAYAEAKARSNPQLCPDPSRDRGDNKSYAAGLYQLEVCKLPPGWGVEFNGVRYDGCDHDTGDLLECKGLSYKNLLANSDNFQTWAIRSGGAKDIYDEMARQEAAAGDRTVIWHVAEPEFAEFLRRYARLQGYTHIFVQHTPPSAAVISVWRKEVMGGFAR